MNQSSKELDTLSFSAPIELDIPFRVQVKHAAAQRASTNALLIKVARHDIIGWGECQPRPYVTGENIKSAKRSAEEFAKCVSHVRTMDELIDAKNELADAINAAPAGWCAVEMATLDLLARETGQVMEEFVGLSAETQIFRYAAIVPSSSKFIRSAAFLLSALFRFTDMKFRPSGDIDRDVRFCRLLSSVLGRRLRLRLDGNGHWAGRRDDCLRDLDRLAPFLAAVEEPGTRQDTPWYPDVAAAFGLPIVLDESFLGLSDLECLSRFNPGQTIVNLKVAKLGGLLRSFDVIAHLLEKQVPMMVGATVGETSLLTRAGQILARRVGPGLFAHEGAAGQFLLRHDPFSPSLHFGCGGRLKVDPEVLGPGFGVHAHSEMSF